MALPQQSLMHNKLLALLPAADYQQLADDFEHVGLPRATHLARAGKPIDYVYFLTSGIGSVVAVTPEGHRAEAGLFGFDGFVPTSAASGAEASPHDVEIQLEGDAYRINYEDFRGWMDRNRNFARLIMRAFEAFSVQLAHTAASNAVHDINERLARWLLMCHDRVSGNEIAVTHDFISLMLAVRRPSVTTSLHILEGNGFIKAERGIVTIKNRPALEEFAQDAYGKPEQEYKRLMKNLF